MLKIKSLASLITLMVVLTCAGYGIAGSVDDFANRVNNVVKQMSKANGIDIKVITKKDSAPEAYVYPCGIIVLTDSILEIAKTDDELAFIIGHEISHVVNGDNKHETIAHINNNLPIYIKHEIDADISGMILAEKAGFNPSASVKFLTKMMKYSSRSFNKRLDAILKFISNRRDTYYWAE